MLPALLLQRVFQEGRVLLGTLWPCRDRTERRAPIELPAPCPAAAALTFVLLCVPSLGLTSSFLSPAFHLRSSARQGVIGEETVFIAHAEPPGRLFAVSTVALDILLWRRCPVKE